MWIILGLLRNRNPHSWGANQNRLQFGQMDSICPHNQQYFHIRTTSTKKHCAEQLNQRNWKIWLHELWLWISSYSLTKSIYKTPLQTGQHPELLHSLISQWSTRSRRSHLPKHWSRCSLFLLTEIDISVCLFQFVTKIVKILLYR